MAKIVDPDQLNQGTEVVYDTGAKTAQLLVAGNLDDSSPGVSSGASGKAIYSFGKEEWKDDTTLRRHRPAMQMIYEASFIWINQWEPADQQTRDLIRDAGFQEQTTGRENACIISLGSMDAPLSDQAYYQNITGFDQATIVFDKTGELNENVQIFDGGVSDFRDFFKAFLREQGKIYAEYNLLVEQGLSALSFQAYRLPLANDIDLKINESDANIDANPPYTGMKINYLKGVGFTTWMDATVYPAEAVVLDAATGRWFFTPAGGTSSGTEVGDDTGVSDWESYDGEEDIGGTWFAFNRIVTGNNGTEQEIYNWKQRQLRRVADINADDTPSVNQQGFGVVNGNVAVPLGAFVGDNLKTDPGVLIRGFNANATNSIQFNDITVDGGGLDSEGVPVTSTERAFPFVAAGNFEFSDNLVGEPDADTRYTAYFTYIRRATSTGVAITGAGGSSATLDWTADSGKFDHLQSGDYIRATGWSSSENNGVYLCGATGSDTIALTKQDNVNPSDEAAGASVQVDENPFDSDGAVVANDNSGTPMDGQITAASIAWDFDYDNNTQGGRVAGTDAPLTITAQGLNDAQIQVVTSTIGRSTGQSIPVNANDELNYDNP